MKRLVLGGAFVLALAAASPAYGADEVVAGTDQLVWDNPNVAVAPGEKVTWTFPNTAQAHHVASDGADVNDPAWSSFNSPIGLPAPDASFTFNTPGTYKFVCSVHRSTMVGTVRVGAGATPVVVVVPLSEQPFTNDAAVPATFETATEDKTAPRLASVSAKRVARRTLRVRFRVSEQSDVQVRLKRAGRTVKRATVSGSGLRGITLRGAKAGRYSVEVRATDIAGNRSPLRTARVTVR